MALWSLRPSLSTAAIHGCGRSAESAKAETKTTSKAAPSELGWTEAATTEGRRSKAARAKTTGTKATLAHRRTWWSAASFKCGTRAGTR